MARYLHGQTLVKMPSAATEQDELDWFDRCAAPPHASLLLALSAWTSGKSERALGQIYDALHALDNVQNTDIPMAREAIVLLAVETGVPDGQVLQYARSGCEAGLDVLCPRAVDMAWRLGYAPASLVSLIPATEGPLRDRSREILAAAYLTRGDALAAAALYPRHGQQPNASLTGSGLYATSLTDPEALGDDYIKNHCDLGDCWACAALAQRAYDSDLPDVALAQNEEACACGAGVACIDVARTMFDRGNEDRGWTMLQQGCESDWAPACTEYGLRLIQKGGVEGAATYLDKGCRLGDGASCKAYGPAANSEDDLRGLLIRACTRSRLGIACSELSTRLALGEQQHATVREYAQQACSLGYGPGCMQVAALDAKTGASAEALCAMWQRACTLGAGDGCTAYGETCPVTGKAPVWFRRGCEAGSGKGCRLLAQTLTGTEADQRMQQACELGDSPACATLHVSVMDTDTLKRSCTAGAARACFLLARKALANNNLSPETAGYARAGCKGGIAESCLLASDMLTRLQDVGGARTAVKNCCQTSADHRCCAAWGCILSSQGDMPNALPLLETAWEAGEPSAAGCYGYALMHTGNPEKAREPLAAACKQSGDISCTRLAGILETRDPATAIELAGGRCRDAADADACWIAGRLLFGQQQYTEALTALSPIAATNPDAALMGGDAAKALQSEHARAYYQIACTADKGRGCLEAADISGELSLYEKACTLGMARGCFKAALEFRKLGKTPEAETYLKVGCSMDARYCDPDASPER